MIDWSGKKVLVTGAGGFIGSHLVELLLEAGATVRALVHYNARNDWGNLELIDADKRKAVEVVLGDVQDPFSVRSAVEGRDTVFHLAALIGIPYSYLAPQTYVSTNIVGTLNVLEAVRSNPGTRMVHTSTSETYGTAQYVPIDEKHPLQGQSPYSASKIGADKMAESYWRSFETPVATLRPFNTFGPRQSLRAVIPTIVSQASAGNSIRLGSISPIRDLTFVCDTARAFMAVAASDSALGQTLNSASGKGIAVGDLAAKILELMGSDAEIVSEEARVRPSNSEVERLIGDSTQLRDLTGWAPQIELDDGLRETIEWVRENIAALKPDIYNV